METQMEKKKKKEIKAIKQLSLSKTLLIILSNQNKKQKQINLYKPPYDSSWFETENKVTLDEYIKNLFTIAKTHLKSNVNPDTIKGILVPHSGIRYSGLCSASTYSQLLGRTQAIKRIIILCTNHKLSDNFIGTSYTDIESYNNNRNLKIDIKTIQYLKQYMQIDDNKFNEEHSFFNQLPFIEYIIEHSNKNVKNGTINLNNSNFSNISNVLLLPLLISNSINLLDLKIRDNIKKILITLLELLKNEDTIIICASDLSHINGNFENKYKSNIHQNIRKNDNDILQFLYDCLNGVNNRNQKIDDILFIQNAPSSGTMNIYLFAKLLSMYSGGLEYSSSSSSSSSSNSSESKSPTIYKIMEYKDQSQFQFQFQSKYQNKQKKTQNNNLSLNKLFSRVCCYYTSLLRDNIDINNVDHNFNPLDLIRETNITDISLSSVSYAGLIFTRQPYIETKENRKIENMFSQYEKLALIGLIKDELYNKFDINTKYKMMNHIIFPINSQSFYYNLGVYISVYNTNGNLRACSGTTETNNNDLTILSNIKKITNQLALEKSTYKNINFLPLMPSEFNKLTFNITILYHIKPIDVTEYFGYKFIVGKDGLIFKSNNNNYVFSLTSINENDIRIEKKELLESLCKTEFSSIMKPNKTCYEINNIKLYYNEGLTFSDVKL